MVDAQTINVPESYRIKLDFFEGPLDLLLYLIKKNELDICEVSLSKIAAQYLQYLETMEMLNLDVAGEFILVAATMILLKSRALLPDDALHLDEDEDFVSPVELVKRLLEYKKYKEAAGDLKKFQALYRTQFLREVKDPILLEAKDSRSPLEVNLFDLLEALRNLLKEKSAHHVHTIRHQVVPLGLRIKQVYQKLLEKADVTFEELFFDTHNRNGVIVTFLAVLEMARLSALRIYQNDAFSPIRVQSRLGELGKESEIFGRIQKLVDSEGEMGYGGSTEKAQ